MNRCEVSRNQRDGIGPEGFEILISFVLFVETSFLRTKVFKENKKAQGDLFIRMCSFGARTVWRDGRRAVSSYLGADSRKYQ